jgi:hypothetical protein
MDFDDDEDLEYSTDDDGDDEDVERHEDGGPSGGGGGGLGGAPGAVGGSGPDGGTGGGPVTGPSRGRSGRHVHATQHSPDTGAGKSTTARGKVDRYFRVGGGAEEGRRFASMLNQPSGRATRRDQQGSQHAWQHFYCMMQRLHPERQYAGPDDVRLWDLRPDSKNTAPTREDWLCFQHFSRVISSSTDAARNNVCRVVSYGKRLAMRTWGGRYVEEIFDPRIVYANHHHGMSGLIRRQYGSSVKKTIPLSMSEMKSGHGFVDDTHLKGLLMGASFNCGNTTGGRRPRTIASLRVRHTAWVVQEVFVGGVLWRVPSCKLEFTDEKYCDPRGPRRVHEDFSHMENYLDVMSLSFSFFLYAVFVARNLFVDQLPLTSLAVGATMETRQAALDYFVFCDTDGDVFFDVVPVSPATLSSWTRTITQRMSKVTGLPARGYRAHRYVIDTFVCLFAWMD